jgi:hypothetical protein
MTMLVKLALICGAFAYIKHFVVQWQINKIIKEIEELKRRKND